MQNRGRSGGGGGRLRQVQSISIVSDMHGEEFEADTVGIVTTVRRRRIV